jgi:pyruvate/2-oxoglutarate/acetoin dehydrogenase E1 component
MNQAVVAALADEMRADPAVMLMGEDISRSSDRYAFGTRPSLRWALPARRWVPQRWDFDQ